MWYKFSQLNKEQYCEGAVSKLFIFDIDETLFRTFAKIYVRCTDGTGITLDNQQLNSFDLDGYTKTKQLENPQVTCHYDFDEFKKAKLFVETSQPLQHMIRKLQNIQNNFINKNTVCGTQSKIILNTARSDFDNVDLLKSYFMSYGIDISEVHLHRAGEMPGKSSGERKNILLEQKGYLDGPYEHFEFYDDSMDNLKKFLELKRNYPNKNFVAKVVFPHDYPKQTATVTPENFDAIYEELQKAIALHKANHPDESDLPENNSEENNVVQKS